MFAHCRYADHPSNRWHSWPAASLRRALGASTTCAWSVHYQPGGHAGKVNNRGGGMLER